MSEQTPVHGNRSDERSERIRSKISSSPSPAIRDRKRIWTSSLVLLVLVGTVAIILLMKGDSEAELEMTLAAHPGVASVKLVSDQTRAVSPGCGCHDPRFGKHEWFGASIPSKGFDLSVKSDGEPTGRAEMWQLTAMSAPVGAIDWMAIPEHFIQVDVRAVRAGYSRSLFSDRTTHFVVKTADPVRVIYGHPYPYAAFIPAKDATTTFRSTEPPRLGLRGSLSVNSDTPAQAATEKSLDMTAWTQRGPMIDLLGPTIKMRIDETSDLEMIAARKSISGLKQGESVVVEIQTPFALRLLPYPLDDGWFGALKGLWKEESAKWRKSALQRHHRWLSRGPLRQGRYVDDTPTPRFSTALSEIVVPSAREWRTFESQLPKSITPKISHTFGPWATARFDLPPVPKVPAVGLFGPITDFRSSALTGRLRLKGADYKVARGQEIRIHSDEGISAGKYSQTPLISTGSPTGYSTISGAGIATIDGRKVQPK